MNVAVVGNGPSAAGKGVEIDAHDIVVRMTNFPVRGAVDAGDKITHYAWFGHPETLEFLGGKLPSGPYVVWATLPPSRCRPFDHRHVGDARNVIEHAGIRYIRWVRDGAWYQDAEELGAWPSTGFTCVTMARREWPDAEIDLYGFDAVSPEAPGWHDARGAWGPLANIAHHFAAEKEYLHKMPGVTFR